MKTLYLDMDGVVADFDGYVENVLGEPATAERWPDDKWAIIKQHPRLYRELDLTPEAESLVDFCRQWTKDNNYELLFLSAVPHDNDIHWAFYDKVIWAQRYFPDIPVHFGPYSQDKQHHCRPGDILIDDRTSNIEQWRASGGIGIHHRGDLVNTMKSLRLIK